MAFKKFGDQLNKENEVDVKWKYGEIKGESGVYLLAKCKEVEVVRKKDPTESAQRSFWAAKRGHSITEFGFRYILPF